MFKRRNVLKTLGALPFLRGILGVDSLAAQSKTIAPALNAGRDYFKELGLRTFINAAGTYTSMTGSLMPEAVIEAIGYSATEYVNLDELQDKVGQRIATLLDCEYATVTSSAFGAMSIGMAGVMCGIDSEKVAQLPDTKWLKNEVIIQESHIIGYTHALTNVGAKIVPVKSIKDMKRAINKNTAMLWFLNANTEQGEIKWEPFVEIGKKYNIPTFIDCAADVPPVENLFKFTKMGFDLVAFSGGKGIRGPQSAGLLLGKQKYIAAARLHTPPRGATIGRGMKVNKEEVLGMLVALESYLKRDHKKDWKLWQNQIDLISRKALEVQGVSTEIHVPPHANHVPSLWIRWDTKTANISAESVRESLRNGHPSIETVGDKEKVGITTWMMVPGQERIVASRVHEILNNAV